MATISEELQEALKDNSKWLEQVKMSLTIAAQLYASFQEVEKDYNENLQKCKDEADKCEQTYNQLETEKTAFSEKLTELTQKATEFNTHIEDLKTQMENLHTDSEKLNTQMQGYIGEAEKFNDKINDFKQYLQDEETKNKNTFDSYNQQMSEQGEKLKTLMEQATALNDSATALKTQIDTAKSEFDTKKTDALKALNDNKTQALSEMDTKKTDALNALDTSKTQALSEIDTKKTESLTALNDNKTQAVAALTQNKTDFINALTQSKTDALAAMDTSKSEAITAIQTEGQALSSRVKVLDKAVTWTVGQGMQYATLEAALKEAGKYVTNTGSSITFRIKDGYTQNQPLNIVNQSVRLFFKSEKDGQKGTINVNVTGGDKCSIYIQQKSHVIFQDLILQHTVRGASAMIRVDNATLETDNVVLNALSWNNVLVFYDALAVFRNTVFNNTKDDGGWAYELSACHGGVAMVEDHTTFIANNSVAVALSAACLGQIETSTAATNATLGGVSGNYGWGVAVGDLGFINLIGYDNVLPLTGYFTHAASNVAYNTLTRGGIITR